MLTAKKLKRRRWVCVPVNNEPSQGYEDRWPNGSGSITQTTGLECSSPWIFICVSKFTAPVLITGYCRSYQHYTKFPNASFPLWHSECAYVLFHTMALRTLDPRMTIATMTAVYLCFVCFMWLLL